MREQLLRFLCVSLHNMRRPILPERKIRRQNGRESFATQKTFIVVPYTEELHGRAQKISLLLLGASVSHCERRKKNGSRSFFWGGFVLSPLPFNSSGFFGGLRGQFRRWEAAGGLLQNSLCPELLFKFHHRKKSLAPGSRGSSFERTTKGDFPIFPISFKFFPLLFFFPGMTSAAVSTSWTA